MKKRDVTPPPPRRVTRLLRIGRRTYQHLAAMTGAFALVAFVSHFFDVGWRGFLATLVSQWNEYVRPAVAWPLHILVTVPLGWFGWHVEVPLPIRDYLAVGLLLFFSGTREIELRNGITPKAMREALSAAPSVVMSWPFMTAVYLYTCVEDVVGRIKRKPDRLMDHPDEPNWYMVLAPLFYLGLLLAVNYLVLR